MLLVHYSDVLLSSPFKMGRHDRDNSGSLCCWTRPGRAGETGADSSPTSFLSPADFKLSRFAGVSEANAEREPARDQRIPRRGRDSSLRSEQNLNGAERGTRTPTSFLSPADFKSAASANSAIPAFKDILSHGVSSWRFRNGSRGRLRPKRLKVARIDCADS